MSEGFSRDGFLENINTVFRLATGDGRQVLLELIRVSGLHETDRSQNFSVIFFGPAESPVGKGTYRMENEKLGGTDIFIVPVAGNEKGFEYEAVFNTLK